MQLLAIRQAIKNESFPISFLSYKDGGNHIYIAFNDKQKTIFHFLDFEVYVDKCNKEKENLQVILLTFYSIVLFTSRFL